MRILVIDRFEGTYAICEDKDQKFFAIETNELPAGQRRERFWRSTTRA